MKITQAKIDLIKRIVKAKLTREEFQSVLTKARQIKQRR